MPGRPKSLHTVKHRKPNFEAGRREERLAALLRKKQQIDMLETLIIEYEKQPKPDLKHIRELKRRANEKRSQLAVLSTVDPKEQDRLISLYK